MVTNFDFLLTDKQFDTFSDAAVAAERLLFVDVESCVTKCRVAMESAVKWMYSVDKDLEMPFDDKLFNLMSSPEFRSIVGSDIYNSMNFVRKLANKAVHAGVKVSLDEAKLCLENLFVFLDFVAYCYGDNYVEQKFDRSLLTKENHTEIVIPVPQPNIDLEALMEENKRLKEVLTAKRYKNQPTYSPKPLDLSEYSTRKIYIDVMLRDAGWVEDVNWVNEVELKGMPNASGVGYADYVLYGDDGKPLAVVEAKKTCVDVSAGRQQAKLYADILEEKYGRRPVIFLTNGFDTRIDDSHYPERKVAGIYSKRDLEKLFNLYAMRSSLDNVQVDHNICGRYYQTHAINAVCEAFDKKNRRKALLVMATGSGKTRTVIGLCKILLDKGWVKNILFLADRNVLVTQAKRNFTNLLPNLSQCNICENKPDYSAHCIFSTYQTMMNCIDNVSDEEGRIYTVGHFDLIICDEAHRSIYNKYQDIFNYFDAPLVGLTATPKDEIDKNTYEIFELENGIPTYGYELAQAVKDNYLVDFKSIETTLKFMHDGVAYDDLSEEEKKVFEDTFSVDGEMPDKINASALNEWLFNEDTIKKTIDTLMTHGLKIDYGNKIGKTIIFAKNHDHAERILEVFNKEYPEYPGYAKVIDNYINYAQSLIDEFSDPNKLPQIAISVDMLDTGIDVPEILNLVFFKKVMSKAKFWQMIGRGTRTCEGLMDGFDKSQFYIFDFCGNFDFFRVHRGNATPNTISLSGAIFHLKSQMAYKLQGLQYQTDFFADFRKSLVDDMVTAVKKLNRDNFAVKQHLKYVDQYSSEENYQVLDYHDTVMIGQELAPLIIPEDDDAKALRFDSLLYAIELASLDGKKYRKGITDLMKKTEAIASVANIPEIKNQSELIDKILHTDYVKNADIDDFEYIRKSLRDLLKYVPNTRLKYDTNFTDEILSQEWLSSDIEDDDTLQNYKAKAEFYVRQNQDNEVIAKLKSNIPLTPDDIEKLEGILWNELGTKKEYEAEFGDKPLGEFVREITGLDMKAAKEAFAKYLDSSSLTPNQMYFVNQIVEYIVKNGIMKDLSVLQSPPFTDHGSVVDVFKNDQSLWNGIKSTIARVNSNALLS